MCVEMPESYGSFYKPGVLGNAYAKTGWLHDMAYFEYDQDLKSEFLGQLSLSRSELRLREWNEMSVWDQIKSATDLQKDWKAKGKGKARKAKTGQHLWDLRV